MRKLIDDAVSRGCDATIITSETKDTSVSFDFNRLKTIKNTESLNMNLQVIKAGKLGIANSTRIGGEDELLENALDVAEYGSAVSYGFPAPEPHADPKVFHRDVQNLNVNQMISLGDELAGFIKSLDPSINGSVNIQKSVTQKGISNTHGLDAHLEKTAFVISAGFEFVEGKNLLSSWDWDISTALEYDLAKIKMKLKEDFDLGRNNVSVEPGVYDVAFTPMGFSDVIAPIMACLDGRTVMRESVP